MGFPYLPKLDATLLHSTIEISVPRFRRLSGGNPTKGLLINTAPKP